MGWVWVSLLLLGFPPSPFYLSASTASAVATFAWPPTYPPDPYAPSAPLASTDPLADEDERFPDDIPNPLDPSAPPLSLDSACSEYRRLIDYVCGLFPQAAGVPPSAPPPRALFESFFAPAAPATPSLNFNWFDRVRTALVDADSRVAVLLVLAVLNACSYLSIWRLMWLGVTALLATLSLSMSRCSRTSSGLFARIYRWGLPLVMLWLSRRLAVRNQRLSPILCGSSRGC